MAFGFLYGMAGWYWQRGFLKVLGEAVLIERPGATRELRRFDEFYRDVLAETAPDDSFPQARLTNTMCASVLAASRLLSDGGVPQEARDKIIGKAVIETGSGSFRHLVRGWLNTSADPLSVIHRQKDLGRSSRLMFGPMLEADQDTGPDHAALFVRRCGFADYFRRAGEPELGAHFCAWDAAWIDDINNSPKPIRAERPGTIATGAPHCEFRFSRTAD